MSRMQRSDWVVRSEVKRRSTTDRCRSRRLRVEPLEDRRMLAAVTVYNDLDVVNGDTSSIASLIASDGGDGISLREAITAANSTAGADTIDFAVALTGDTINLTTGVLTATETLTIDASSLAANVSIDAQHNSRVLQFAAPSGNLVLKGLNIRNGNVSGAGGGIYFPATGNLTLTDCTVSGNIATGNGGGIYSLGALTVIGSTISLNSSGGDRGGGICQIDGVLTVDTSTISNNTVYFAGGGIYHGYSSTPNDAMMTITNSTISSNSANYGGGIYTRAFSTTISNTTIFDNQATTYGGGIRSNAPGDLSAPNLTISHSTIVSNSAGTEGGGIRGSDGLVRIEYSTITDNSAGDTGSGVWVYAASYAGAEVLSSIIAANYGGDDVYQYYLGSTIGFQSLGYNIVGGGNGLGAFNQAGDQPGVHDPLLAPLADNGGPTMTLAPLPGSPAINAGDPAFSAPPDFDQRGTGFPRVLFGRIDIGAYEFDDVSIPSRGLVVDSNDDVFDGDYSPGHLTLREALDLANANAGANTVTFDAALSGSTISLDLGELAITDTVTIDASALDENVTIDAHQQSRVLNFSATTGDLSLSGLNLINGYTTGETERGAGIRFNSSGALTLTSSTVSGNQTTGDFAYGGGIYTYAGAVTLNSSTVTNNHTIGSSARAGGIFDHTGDVTLTESTVSGNSTVGTFAEGGGIWMVLGPVTLTRSAISGNSTSGTYAHGGGIRTQNGDVVLTDSTLSGNSTSGANANGGGIRSSGGVVTLNDSTLSENHATGDNTEGGGIWSYLGAVTLNSTTVSGNSSGRSGGGVYAKLGAISLTSSTVSGNSNTRYYSLGGGIVAYSSTLTITSSTITENSSSEGGGIFNTDSSTMTIENSIVAGNSATAGSPDLLLDLGGTPTVTHSLIGDNAGTELPETQTADANGNLIGSAAGGGIIDAMLGPLQNNGGLTETQALLPGSPAIDAGFVAPENVALGGTATQSSEFEFASFPASNAIDGDLTTFTHTDVNDNMASWQVDLGGSYAISEVVLHNRDLVDTALRLRDITVEVLNSNGVPVYTSPLLNPENVLNGPATLTVDLVSLTGSAVVGSTVRVSRTADPDNSGGGSGAADQNVLSLAEVEVNATPAYDQRGAPFTRFSGPTDMGAYEAQTLSLVVDTNVDESDGDYSPGDLSLREAIELANDYPGADTITFDGSLAGLSIDLVLGELLISDDVTIVGLGSSDLTVDAQGNSRVFDVNDGFDNTIKDVAISGLTVTGGVSNDTDPTPRAGRGGGILSVEHLTLSDTVVTGNQTNVDGGGIWSGYGDLSLTGSTVSGNTAKFRGGGIYTRGNTLDVTGSTILGNAVTNGGGIFVKDSSTANIANTTIADNTATHGGGLYLQSGSMTILSAVMVDGNTAAADFYFVGAGGGIWNAGNLTITGSTISNNSTTTGSDSGAGIWNNNVLSISRSTISGNSSAQDGGGIYSTYGGDVTITYSTISNNTAGDDAGGIWTYGQLAVSNTTISGNSSTSRAGGIASDTSSTTIRHSTIVGNSSSLGGGIGVFSGTVTLDHTIVANNTATSSGPDINGTVTVNWSLIEDTTGATIGGANNITGLDPLLGPLADNGGPTQTHALMPGSPAINAGDPTAVAGVGSVPLYDQRGTNFERVQAGRIDIGAYELLLADGNLDGQVDGLDYLLWASHYPDNPAADPPGTPQNGDYNNDGKVDGVDYLLWASQYLQGTPAVAASQPAASTQEQLAAVDTTFANAYSVGATVQDWQVSQAFDAVLKHDTVLKRKDKKDK